MKRNIAIKAHQIEICHRSQEIDFALDLFLVGVIHRTRLHRCEKRVAEIDRPVKARKGVVGLGMLRESGELQAACPSFERIGQRTGIAPMCEARGWGQPLTESTRFEPAGGELSVNAENIGFERLRRRNHHGTVVRSRYFLFEKIHATHQKYAQKDGCVFYYVFHN